jgi:RND family efflux transporter MFP subunit
MSHHLVVGSCFAVIALGVSAPVLVSPRTSIVATEAARTVTPAAPPAAAPEPAAAAAAPDAGFLGVVVALQSVDVAAKFDGTLERLDVHVGDRVKGGAVIGALDGRSTERDLAMAEAAVRVAEAEHDRLVAELDDAADKRARLNRIPELVPHEQITAADTQERVASARLRSAVADLAGKRARVDQLAEMLKDTRLVAPFDGTIATRYVEAGTTVSRSTPVVRVISPGSLVIRFAVPEEQAAGLAAGRPVTVKIASTDLTADAAIASIAPEIDAALRMVVVEARLTAPDNTVSSGAVARVLITNHERSAR